MANFYTDNEDLKFHLGHPLMQKIVALKERNFEDAGKCEIAPRDFEDAMDNYDRVLEIVGDICGNVLAENAESVDHEGPEVIDGRVNMLPELSRIMICWLRPDCTVCHYRVSMTG